MSNPITEEDWKEFRAAALRKDDEAALASINSILAKDAGDSRAQKEKGRLLKKEGKRLLEEIDEAVRAEDRYGAANLVTKVEAIPGMQELCASSSAWKTAYQYRYQILHGQKVVECRQEMQKFRDLVGNGNLMQAEAMIEPLRELEQQYPGCLTDDDQAQIVEAEKALARDRVRAKDQRIFNEALGECKKHLTSFDNGKQTMRSLLQGEIDRIEENLKKSWAGVGRLKGKPPTAIEQKVNEAIRQLQGETRRRKRAKKRKKLTVVGIVTCVIGAAAFFGYITWEKKSLKEAIDSHVASRDFAALEATLSKAKRYKSNVEVAKKISIGQIWLDRERSEANSVGEKLAKWEKATESKFADVTDFAAADAEVKDIDKRVEAAPEFFKTQLQPRAAKVSYSWRKHVRETAEALMLSRETILTESELLFSEANVEVGLDEKLIQSFADLDAVMSADLEDLKPAQELIRKHLALSTEFREAMVLANQVSEVKEKLVGATSLEQYLAALNDFQRDEFLGLKGQKNAQQIVLSNPDPDKLLGELILPGDLYAWSMLFEDNGNLIDRLAPNDALPGDLLELNKFGDKFLTEVYEVKGRRVSQQRKLEGEIEPFLVVGGLPEESGTEEILFVRMYLEEEDNVRLESLYPTSSQQLVPECVYLTTELDPSARMLKFSKRGFKPDTSIQSVVDDLVMKQDLNPMFRALLFQKLVGLAELRPAQWQCALSPDLLADNARLKQRAGNLSNKDWFSRTKADSILSSVEGFFDSLRGKSYDKQLKLNRELIRLAKQAGCHYAGYVTITGEPHLLDWTKDANAFFTLDPKTSKAKAYFQAAAAGLQLSEETIPFTPIFAIKGDTESFLPDAAASVGIPMEEARNLALPFFISLSE